MIVSRNKSIRFILSYEVESEKIVQKTNAESRKGLNEPNDNENENENDAQTCVHELISNHIPDSSPIYYLIPTLNSMYKRTANSEQTQLLNE